MTGSTSSTLEVQTRCSVARIAEIVIEESGLDARIDYTGGDRGWVGDVPSVDYDISKSERSAGNPAWIASLQSAPPPVDVERGHVKVVVLCGGKGTRLGMKDRPKPMVPIAGTPLLERLVRGAKLFGFTDFVFLNGHLAEVIEVYFGNGTAFGVHIEHLRESGVLGTAGAVRDARHLLNEPFIVLYGDVLIDVDLAHFASFHQTKGGLGSLFVHPNSHPHDSDLVQMGADHRIVRFLSKPHSDGGFRPNLVNGGHMCLTQPLSTMFAKVTCSTGDVMYSRL